MNTSRTIASTPPNRREAVLALLGVAFLPACGGGTDVAGISSGGTGSFTTGTITGLGSVIVNRIRYEDRLASISLDGRASDATALKLGMVVRIQGSAIVAATTTTGLASANASSISCAAEWKAKVEAVDTVARTFTLLGQTVHVLDTTVFDNGLLSLALVGQPVEVYGFVDPGDTASGQPLILRATRVEIKTSLNAFRLSGVITGLDRNASRFQLGTATIEAPAGSTNGLINGQLVRVELQTTTTNGGPWVATEVRIEDYRSELEDEHEAELEGTITALTATGFLVNGIPVDTRRITPPVGLAVGVRVEVHGVISGGVVIATEVETETDDEVEAQAFEFHGTVSGLTANSFDVRGYTIRYDGSTQFDLQGASLANGLSVEVKARLQTNGSLLATTIEAESHD